MENSWKNLKIMNHPKNKQELTKEIQKIKEITKGLEDLYHERGNQEAYNMSHLLALMTNLFEEVDQRLKALEKNHEKK